MRIQMTRGDLLQLSQSVQRLAPAKRDHAERFRLAADSIVKKAERVNKEHKAEIDADLAVLPVESRTQERIAEVRESRAKTLLSIEIEPQNLQVLVAAYVAFWRLPAANGVELGMPYEALRPLAEDLKVLKVWDAWNLGAKLIVEDPELEKEFPVGELPEDLEAEFPVGALSDDDGTLSNPMSRAD